MSRMIDIVDLLNWAFHDELVETSNTPPGDALTVYWAVMALPEPFGGIVRHYARIGTAPNWCAEKTRIVYLAKVRHDRRTYSQWHRALTVLQRSLSGAMADHVAYGPTVAEEPWSIGRPPSRTDRQAL